ncbi:ribosomal protein mitochondrial [Diplodia corticola]|uniref:Ribosomal protein mitochondrial n=1 Tax=Diplodia corticola TaxID=236234 RepID=A0A1J9QYR1_9PEZI|nr:ribosomal protein mitochondrial [Diplodia corticola]OJD33544.1 ribosomal protein mitochondrial [Diplodia corticola]
MFSVTARRLAQRQPMIRFLGKHNPPANIDHTPRAHPAAPSQSLPESFASYRQKAQQHGPLNKRTFSSGSIGSQPGSALGSVNPGKGEYFDRSELPPRFGRLSWSAAEIEAIESGGASLVA